MRHVLLAHRLFVALSASSLFGCGSSSANAGTPDVLNTPEGAEVTPFAGWSVPGVRLFRRCYSVPDESHCEIVGVDASNTTVGGPALFRRLPRSNPDALAHRALDLLRRSGE